MSYVSSDWNEMPWMEEAQKKQIVQPNYGGNFDTEERIDAIHRTLEGAQQKGPEESVKSLISLLGDSSIEQRQLLKQNYAIKFGGHDLMDEIRKRLPASELITVELLQALTDTPPVHNAKYLHKAMKGLGTNEDMLIEILVSRSNKQIRAIKEAYHTLYQRELAKHLASETSGTLRKLLLDLLEADREEGMRESVEKAKQDAQAIYKAGEARWGTDEAVFVKILANQNIRQLRILFDEYEKLTGRQMEKAIRAEFSGDSAKALLALAEFVRNGPVGQVAKLMQKCIEGKANEELLVHLIYTYKELNILNIIADEYAQKFKGPLAQAIQNSAKSAILKNSLVYLIKRGKL